MRGFFIRHIALLALLTVFVPVVAQTYSNDSTHVIAEVEVSARRSVTEIIAPQTLNGEQLQRFNSLSVADALRFFSGLQVKDYGGVGGLKTVNIRSMGSQHFGVYYDGVELGNAQNGQIDLGQYSMADVEEISLYNGNRSALFQTASDFGNAGSVYIRTIKPHFSSGETYHLKSHISYGSSNKLQLASLYQQKISESVSGSLSLGILSSDGKYKFRYKRKNYDGSLAYDTTAVRQNGDIFAFRGEGNLYGIIDKGCWTAKAYTYHSNRGIPGAIVNNVWRRGERLSDHNTFVQGWWQKDINALYSAKMQGKVAFYNNHYVNREPSTMLVDNCYKQQEAYISTIHAFEITDSWNMSFAYDLKYNMMQSDMATFNEPTRLQNMASVATQFSFDWLKVQGSLFAVNVNDRQKNTSTAKHTAQLAPALFVSTNPFNTSWLILRAFAKRSFRMPTFNELYYVEIGNALLKPELATQYDAGFIISKHYHTFLHELSFQADAYYNNVKDKIVAYPKGSQFRWTMLNLGRVHIKGADVNANAVFVPAKDFELTLRGQYTYQDARDVTDANTSYYNDQIPYTPWHSGSVMLGLRWKQLTLNYSFIYTGERYSQQENILYNHLEPWYTNDVNITYDFRHKKTAYRLMLEVNNLLSQDYDVILNYPMPKRNYALSLDINI